MEYLPDALRPYREMQAAMAGQQSLFEELWQAVDRGLDDQFLGSSGTYGLSRWETMLRLPARATDLLTARRSRIQARLNEQPPFTLRALRFQLDTLCGEGNCTAELAEGGCKLSVRTSAGLNATKVCGLLGGGGHAAAAGCTVSGTLEQAEQQIMDAIRQVEANG